MTAWARWGALVLLAGMKAASAATVDDLFTAVAIDNLRAFRTIVQDGVPKGLLDKQGDTILIAAVRNDSAKVFDFLVDEKKVDLEAVNVSGETALMIAAYRDRPQWVERLIARGAEVNRPGWTALHYAATVDSRESVRLLLEHAAYIDAESPNRTTPLMMAARGGHAELCRILVWAGADPTPENERDLSAAGFARRKGDTELAEWLDTQSHEWRAKYGSSSTRRPVTTGR